MSVSVRKAGRVVVGIVLGLGCWRGGFQPARADEGQSIDSILQSGIPVEADPQAILRDLRSAQASPFHPVDQIPTYGLPHDLVATTVGRLVFRMDDLSLPGKVPIKMSRVYDSGMHANLPPPPPGDSEEPRPDRDFGGSVTRGEVGAGGAGHNR